ncbi:MAG: DUF1579 family protein [Phycisphaerae bacterium]
MTRTSRVLSRRRNVSSAVTSLGPQRTCLDSFVGTWADNMNTRPITMSGRCDPSGKAFAFYGEMDEPMLDIHGRMVKSVSRIINNDKHVFEIYDLHAGDNYKVLEIACERQ